MENPFEIINDKLEHIETMLENIFTSIGKNDTTTITPKIMDITQLTEYLGLSKSHIYKLKAHIIYLIQNEVNAYILIKRKSMNGFWKMKFGLKKILSNKLLII